MTSHEIQFIEASADDYFALTKKNVHLKRVLINKFLFIEMEPHLAGVSLTGNLSGMRKLKVGDRIWRIVWKVKSNNNPEVWGIGKRDHNQIYNEVEKRIKLLEENPATVGLAHLIDGLKLKAIAIKSSEEISPEVLQALRDEMGLSMATIKTLTPSEAKSLYERYLSKI